MYEINSYVVLKLPLIEHGLRKGDGGVVVYVHQEGKAYEVEFLAADLQTIAVVTVEAEQVWRPSDDETPQSPAV
ncbi:DUF4926 domain-containing protein [Roseateles sp. PN1]|uniref:DUF4926 domain-containing protein n=1 Tax=Roseateles sp. PN1 TaxID=3137372 RepID=UPI003138BC8E